VARYKTLNPEEAADAIDSLEGLEAIVADGKLSAIIAGRFRIYPLKDVLVVSKLEAKP
jgi:hypothetical protein